MAPKNVFYNVFAASREASVPQVFVVLVAINGSLQATIDEDAVVTEEGGRGDRGSKQSESQSRRRARAKDASKQANQSRASSKATAKAGNSSGRGERGQKCFLQCFGAMRGGGEIHD